MNVRTHYPPWATITGLLRGMWIIFKYQFRRPATICYPEQKAMVSPRPRGRIVLTRDPDGEERCVGCYLCAVVCPVDCIALQATEDENGRRYPEWFQINFSRCIYCGFCEEACPTYAIQLTPDYEMAEHQRGHLIYQKDDLLIDGPGKRPEYNFYHHAGVKIDSKDKHEAIAEESSVDVRDLLP